MQGQIFNILRDSKLGIDIQASSDTVVSDFQKYLDLLVKWNRKINLTSEKSSEEILQRHVFDSIQYCRFIEPDSKLLDIGSGAGFPGIPLKIIFPKLQLVMVESQRKRCSFLEAVVRELGFQDTKVFNSRAEDISTSEEGRFNAVVFRAVTDSFGCLSLAERFISAGGKIILKKDTREDIKSLGPQSKFLLQKEITIKNYHGVASNMVVFEKCFT
jgi:16S rRNA (guanine527-N7)-methyltransferase